MTTVQSNTNTVSQTLLDNMNGKSSSSKSSSVDDVQNRFMTLLIQQMKSQDPLNPMDNAQVTSQMAQLSTVTGVEKLNTTMESLISSVQASQSYQASSMIGHNVLVTGNQISTNKGSGGYLGAELPVGADSLIVDIKNSAGTTIRTLDFGSQDAGTIPLKWDGLTADGSVAADGNYKFELTAKVSGQSVTATGLNYAQVLSVSNNSSGVKLNLGDGSSVNTADVKEIF
ncbi:MAG: flagellar hook assembly protein FlgD [Methylophilus sp.]